MTLGGIRRTVDQAGPVVVTLLAAGLTISTLALGPGSLTSRAGAGQRPVAARAAMPAQVVRVPQPPVRPHLIQVIGLGGGSDWGPPNTLSAVENSAAAGVDGIEVDVAFTADGLPVVFPDGTLTKAPDCTGPVAGVTFARLAACGLVGAHAAATLDTVLSRAAPGPARIYLYLPAADGAAIRRVMTLVDKYHLGDPARLTVLASSAGVLEQFRRAGGPGLGLVFSDATGWASPYRVLVVGAAAASAVRIADAQRRGHFVVVAADSRAAAGQSAALRPDGVMAHDVGGLLRQ